MIKKLHKLKSGRGFTTIELIVVVAILAVLVSTVFVSSSNKRDRIKDANSTAADFYSAVQTEFTRFQMYDAPLTVTLSNAYKTPNLLQTDSKLGGVKYFPAVGGNYPFKASDAPASADAHLTELPKANSIFIEVYVIAGRIKHVDWAVGGIETLLAKTGGTAAADKSELSAVLELEMKERMEYKDGYYYARISYTPPTGIGPTKYDYRERSVKVMWTAYTSKEITNGNASSYTFKTQNTLESGYICGVCKPKSGAYSTLGTPGTNFLANG